MNERIFWFDGDIPPASLGKDLLDQALENTLAGGAMESVHDHALLCLLAAIHNDPDFRDPQRWAKAFEAWKRLADDEDYWGAVLESEMGGGFEPAATADEIEQVRGKILAQVADIVAGMAREAVAQGQDDRFQRAVKALRASDLPTDLVTKVENETFGSREDSFSSRCTALRRECGDKIERDEAGVDGNRAACAAALAKFDAELQPELFKLTSLAGATSDISRRSREAAASLLMSIAIDYTWANEFITSEKLLNRAKELAPEDSIVSEKIEEQLSDVAEAAQSQRFPKGSKPLGDTPEDKFEALCMAVRVKCRDSIRREDDGVSANRKACEAALGRFDTEIKPSLEQLLKTVGADSPEGRRARDTAAMCLHSIGIDLTWANEFKIAEATLGEGLALVPPKSATARKIADSLEKFPRSKSKKESPKAPSGRSSAANDKPAARKREWERIDPIKSAPELRTINGIGFTLYGNTDPEPIDPKSGYTGNSYLTTYYFVVLAIPVIPIARYRVIYTGDKRYLFLHKAPLRTFDKVHLGISIALCLWFFFAVNQGSSSSSYSGSTSSSSSYSSSQRSRSSLRTDIESNKRRIQELEGQLKIGGAEIERLKGEIMPLKKQIEDYESDAKLGNYVDQDAYQKAIDDHNALVGQLKAEGASYKKIFAEYDPLVDKTNGLIREYKR
ncbi:MAG: hypothetical protein M0D55_15050 [Elusimicrobiota bacterium]|nr:MAG: hypothetical protein M0D55_15050 [Elusimicrobiota bacterium]